MSMDSCKHCGAWVDTDDDPECYVPDPKHPKKLERCICESCREKIDPQWGDTCNIDGEAAAEGAMIYGDPLAPDSK